MTVVAFGSNDLDIYKVNDVMASRGWSLNALHRPARYHNCLVKSCGIHFSSFCSSIVLSHIVRERVASVKMLGDQFHDCCR